MDNGGTMRQATQRGYYIFLHLALAGLATLVLALTHSNRELRGAHRDQPPQLAAGDRLAALAARQLDGTNTTLRFSPSQGETLLLVFTTTCPVCEKNTASWISLYERFREDFEFIGVAVDDVESTASYASRLGLPYRVVIPNDVASFPRQYRINAVPTTILVGTDGRVKQVWTGPLTDADVRRLASVASHPKDSAGFEPAG